MSLKNLPIAGICLLLCACFYEPEDPNQSGPYPDTDDALGLRATTLFDDRSQISTVPGSYEWWNFFAAESGGYDGENVSISTIFNPADLFNLDYRKAVYDWRRDPENLSAPDPLDYPLLQINVTQGEKKLFSTIAVPEGTATEFSHQEAYGRFYTETRESSFRGYYDENGLKTFEVIINAVDTFTRRTLEARVIFKEEAPGFTIDNQGLYGMIKGGAGRHHWQSSIGFPRTQAEILIRTERGKEILNHRFQDGTGLADHMWGEGLLGDVLKSWYWGKVDLGDDGILIYVYLTPRYESDEQRPYGRVFLISPQGGLPELIEVSSMNVLASHKGSSGLTFNSHFRLALVGGGFVEVQFGNPAVEDWPFQVAGPSQVDILIPGIVEKSDQAGIGEFLSQKEIDAPLFQILYGLLKLSQI